jgi:hypothetical protein
MTSTESHRTRPAQAKLASVAAASLAVLSLTSCIPHKHHDGSFKPQAPATTPSTDIATESPNPAATSLGAGTTPMPKVGSVGKASSDGAPAGGGHGRCPAYPTPDCTGAPTGTQLTALAMNDGDGYKVTKPGTVLDGVHIAGDLLIAADNVTIKNSQIDGGARNEVGTTYYPFTIIDSTVGPAHGCQSNDGVGRAKFTASGVLVRGHSHGFMDSGDNIKIHDSYVRNCSNGNDHADGIQAYVPGKNLVLDHNTLDQRNISDFTAPIYLSDSAGHTITNVTVTNNLVMGGTYSIQLKNASGTLIVQNNRMVDKTWSYAPVESECSVIDWSGNTLVTIDANYRITSTVGPLPCKS